MINRLRKKLIAVSMLSLIAVLAIIVAGMNLMNYNKIVVDSDTILQMLAENEGKFPERETPVPRPADNINMRDLRNARELPFETRYFFVLLEKNGQVISSAMDRIAAVDEATAKDYAQKVWREHKHKGFMGNYRYIKFYEGENIRIIFMDATRAMDNFYSFMTISIAVSLVGLVAVFFLIVIFSGQIIKPISESYEKQKQFITDAGHEIKTPITIIDADAEVLEMDIGENEWIKDIRKQTERLGTLTNNLIYLAKMEENKDSLQMIDFPISDIISEAAQSFEALAKTQNKTFETDIEKMLTFHGDEKAIAQLINILLDNALKYSDSDGSIKISLYRQPKAIVIKVSNPTKDINGEDLSNLFDRFFRGDKSRNSKKGGYGIGLSIAQAIVNAHKGKITAEIEKDDILVITIVLPV